MWKRLRHPNIVPFLGVTTDPLQFVSEWMPNGTLTDYVNDHAGADRITLVSHFESDDQQRTSTDAPFSCWMWRRVSIFFTLAIPFTGT